jgi:pseudouridine kinase
MTVCAFGAIHLDTLVHASRKILPETSTPAVFSSRPGGVATNVARGLARLGCPVRLVGALGRDADAAAVRSHLEADALVLLAVERDDAPTGRYIAFHDPDGSLPAATVDGRITDTLQASAFDTALADARKALCWFVEANLPEPLLLRLAGEAAPRLLAADAVSRAKAARLLPILPRLDLLFCNRAEALAILGPGADDRETDTTVLAETLLGRGPRACLISDGDQPLVVADAGGVTRLAPPAIARIRDVTGAGDALVAGTLCGLDAGLSLTAAATCGLNAAALTLGFAGAVADTLSFEAVVPRGAETGAAFGGLLDSPPARPL